MRRIYGIGETVYDIIFRNEHPQRAVPGGSTFNSLISLGRCGLHPTMVTETGDDHVGRIIKNFMAENGVSTDFVTINPGTKTHISLAFLDENNDARYQFYKDHASASVEVRFPEFHADDIVLFGSFFAVNPVIRNYTHEFLQRAHDAGCILYYDVNFRAAHKADLSQVLNNIEENMSLATVVRGSTEDFQCIYGTENPEEVYTKHIAHLCSNFICTDGPDVIQVYNGDVHTTIRNERVEINTISTIGAGDNFNAGFIYAICRNNLHLSDFATNINSRDVKSSAVQFIQLIPTGERFAQNVCQSWDNYVSADFVASLAAEELERRKAFLFDLDGVIIDTEGQYQEFWAAIGREFLPEITDFATRIKGSTLVAIHETYFPDLEIRAEVDRRLFEYEEQMQYRLFERVEEFVCKARQQGHLCAIVTSSNCDKMDSLAKQQPSLTSLFDKVFTAEDAGRGKPFPDCYIKAAQYFGYAPEECAVFEDSINGLKAARSSGAFVVGLTTTHEKTLVAQYADAVVSQLVDLIL